MVLAKLIVDGVSIRPKMLHTIPAGIVGATVELYFNSPEWQHLKKTVVFQGCVSKDVLDADTTVEIPAEVVAEPGWRVSVGVYGTDFENNEVIPTLWCDLGPVAEAADPSEDVTTNPLLPVWAQVLKTVGDINELQTLTKESLVAAINEVYMGGGHGTADPEEVARMVELYLKDHTDPKTMRFEDGVLSVNLADEPIQHDMRPITSNAVYNEFSKAVALLRTI